MYFQDFPNADTITRRLKKLILLIVRHEKEAGFFDYESKEYIDPELEEFKPEEKKEFFYFISDMGIPINPEGKPNWNDIREKFYAYNSKYDAKNVILIEKLVQELRMVCHQIIQRSSYEQSTKEILVQKYKVAPLNKDLNFTVEEAQRFYHNTNVLKFIRKTILFNNMQIFKNYQEELIEESCQLTPEDPAYIADYKPEVQDV